MPILGIMASQISGHLWAPEGAYDSLATVTLSATTASVSFAGIPAGYKHLQIRSLIRGASTTDAVRGQFNSDTTAANYSAHLLGGDGTSAFASGAANFGKIGVGFQAPSTAGANMFAANVLDILDYASTSKAKTTRFLGGNDRNGSGSVGLFSSAWYRPTEAITSILIFPDSGSFAANSTFALYGIK